MLIAAAPTARPVPPAPLADQPQQISRNALASGSTVSRPNQIREPGANARRLIGPSFPGSAWECQPPRLPPRDQPDRPVATHEQLTRQSLRNSLDKAEPRHEKALFLFIVIFLFIYARVTHSAAGWISSANAPP